jgi:hypothetical protein
MITSDAITSKSKQASVAYVKLLSQHLAGETEENHEKSQSREQVFGRGLHYKKCRGAITSQCFLKYELSYARIIWQTG